MPGFMFCYNECSQLQRTPAGVLQEKESVMKHKRIFPLSWLLAAALALTGCTAPAGQSRPSDSAPADTDSSDPAQSPAVQVDPDFTAYTEDYVREACENSYMVMHQYFEHPEAYGIDPAKAEITLGTLLPDEEDLEMEDEMAARLDTFDVQDLDPTQKVIYDTLKFQFDYADQAYDSRYSYLDQIWNEYTNPADILVQTFSEYEIREEKDIAPLVTLIRDTPRFVDDCFAYTSVQAEKNLLMLDYDGVREKCEAVIEAGTDSAVSANLQEEIQELNLPADKETEYLKQVNQALEDAFYPQFERICTDLKPFQDKSRDFTGLANLEHGKDYYAALVMDATGTTDTPEEMKENLEDAIASLSLQMQMMMKKDPDSVAEASSLTTDFESVDEIMDFLETRYDRDFPGLEAMTFEVQPLTKEQANPGVMAYFMIPPVDNTAPYRIRFNSVDYGDDTRDIMLYDTLAHEGIPGHMYQTQYDHQTFIYPIQYMLSNSGFTEGYATYVEGQANKWLDAEENAIRFYNWMMMLSNCYTALMDISVNWDGVSLEEFNEEYGPLFGTDDLSATYTQLVCMPSTFQSYYYGNWKIMTLRNQAQKELGDDFDNLGFNQALLQNGSVPFAIVEQNIQAYIDSAK